MTSPAILVCMLFCSVLLGQAPLYDGIPVSDTGSDNNIGNANTSRNIAVDTNGSIYVVYTGDAGIRVSKSQDGGQSFLPSVLVSATNAEPGITVNNEGVVFVAWLESGNIMLSNSADGGMTFSVPASVGVGEISVHMETYHSTVYLIDRLGKNAYSNDNNGQGAFNNVAFTTKIYADIRTDQNGVAYVLSDDPDVHLYKSTDNGQTFSPIALQSSASVFFSSYALSDGPCGTFIFVGGNVSKGYRINVDDGEVVQLTLGYNNLNKKGRTLFADHRGTLIDGYQNDLGELVMRISSDQGQTFSAPVIIAQGGSHNIARNPVTEDIVVVYEQNGQIYVSVYDNLLKSIKIEPEVLTTCYQETLTIPYKLGGVFSTGTELEFYISDQTGNFENKDLIGSVITNESGNLEIDLADTYLPNNSYRIIIESPADCIQSNIVDLKINESADAVLFTNGSICEGEDAVFTVLGTPNSEVFYTVNGNQSSNSLVLDASGAGEVVFTEQNFDITMSLLEVLNGETACSKLLSQSETILVNPLPVINFDSDYILCVNTNGSETIGTPPIIDTFLNSSDYNFTWYVNGVEKNEYEDMSSIIPNTGGDYMVEVSYKNTGCTTLSNTFFVFESAPPIISAEVRSTAFADSHIVQVEAKNTADFNEIAVYEFSLNNSPWVLGSGNPGEVYNYTFTENVRLGANKIRVRDLNGCGENDIEIVVMDYPLYFTPNGDGDHESWNIAAPQSPHNYLAAARIFIHDRYGKLLKQLDPLGPGWNGSYNGRLMPTDDYWFTVDFIDPLDDQQKQFTAHFTLKR